MASKHVYIAFDWDHDRNYKFLLNAWTENPDITFSIDDYSSTEIKTDDIPRVKAALTAKINAATYTLVLVGAYANSRHQDSAAIGYDNWINFEVARSKAAGNKLVAVSLNSLNSWPAELKNAGASWAREFSQAAIEEALRKA